MSSLVEMVQRTEEYKKTIKEGGIPNTQLLELMYADDTMLISKKAESSESILHLIEQFAPYFGLTLNRTKCAHLRINNESSITFVDDSPTSTERNHVRWRKNKRPAQHPQGNRGKAAADDGHMEET